MVNTDLLNGNSKFSLVEHSDLKFENPDFETLAKSLGMWGAQITSADQFIPALKEAFKQKRACYNWCSSRLL